MQTTALDPFGIAVHDLDLREPEAAAQALRPLLDQHGVAVLRDQPVDDAGFVALLEAFGPMTFTAGETPAEGAPMLNVVSNVGRKTPPRSVFHSDTTYVATPPSYTALRPVTLPRAGGATLVCDQCAAFDRLTLAQADALRTARVKHRVTGLEGREEEIWHPLLRRIPGSARVALFLSTPERCIEMEGAGDAAPDIETLYAHSIAGPVYRHEWRPGDILIWDNRSTMHRADHSGVSGDRVMHRGMVSGEAPLPAFG